jgi:hypothetical protein
MSQNIRSRDTSQRRNRTVRNDAPTRPLFSTASNQHFGSLPLIPCRGHKVSLTPKKENERRVNIPRQQNGTHVGVLRATPRRTPSCIDSALFST